MPWFGEYPSSEMTSEDGDESMTLLDRYRPIGAPTAAPPPPLTKPRGGVRLLSFLLQVLVMSVALSLFFLFAGVAALVLLHLFIAGRSLRRRRRHLHPLVRRPPYDGPALLSPRDLRTLPCFDYPDGDRSATDCAVCLEGFREGDRCRALPGCNHAFHMICIDRWLVRSPACPICRGGVAAVPQPVGWF